MAEPYFVLVKAPNGKRMLLNLDVAAAIGEGDDGKAIMMTLAGAPVATGERFELFQTDLLVPR